MNKVILGNSRSLPISQYLNKAKINGRAYRFSFRFEFYIYVSNFINKKKEK